MPYYLNLAPNYDLTLEPRYMSERGTQVRSDFRYLMPNSRGEFGFEYLPDDEETQTARRYANLQHESLFGFRDQLEVLSGIEGVSDDAYFEDLGTQPRRHEPNALEPLRRPHATSRRTGRC